MHVEQAERDRAVIEAAAAAKCAEFEARATRAEREWAAEVEARRKAEAIADRVAQVDLAAKCAQLERQIVRAEQDRAAEVDARLTAEAASAAMRAQLERRLKQAESIAAQAASDRAVAVTAKLKAEAAAVRAERNRAAAVQAKRKAETAAAQAQHDRTVEAKAKRMAQAEFAATRAALEQRVVQAEAKCAELERHLEQTEAKDAQSEGGRNFEEELGPTRGFGRTEIGRATKHSDPMSTVVRERHSRASLLGRFVGKIVEVGATAYLCNHVPLSDDIDW